MLEDYLNLLLPAAALSIACALLSVFVVLRHWAFIGEGISHSGFGGAGVAWLAALLHPALDVEWMPYLSVIVFCIVTALLIGALSRARGVNADAAIGIFMVASLAFGFVAQQVYYAQRQAMPLMFENLLFGQIRAFSPAYSVAAVCVSLAVLLTIIMLFKEILAYCFDPLTAHTGGVRAGFIHYLLMVLLAVTIVIGVRVAGTVLVTALLVLPGATAMTLSQRLRNVIAISIAANLIGAAAGLGIHGIWPVLPAGPMIVLVLFVVFLLAFGYSRVARSAG
jgi:ABC-type Mn2+/Zn2+ transport system permease subunit